MPLDGFLDAIVGAMRQQVSRGRSHGQLAVELGLKRRTVSRIISGERGIGVDILLTIMGANPPWLREVLAGKAGPTWGGHGKGCKGRPN
jgi:hypothetical protein